MKKVLILFGGNSYEHDISCKSVNFVLKNIDRNLFYFNLVGIDHNNEWFLLPSNAVSYNWKEKAIKRIDNILDFSKNFDIVFPLIHGNTGEDGKIQTVFELNNIKYVGTDSYSSLICYDKLITKLILEKYSIPQVPYTIFNNNFNGFNYPVIVKPAKCGSSLGMNVAKNKSELKKAVKIAKKYDNKILIENYIESRKELECAILEKKGKLIVSDVGEIVSKNDWYDYKSKYLLKTETRISDLDSLIKEEIRNYSKYIFKTLGCLGMSRIDFLYDLKQNKLYFNEINTIPGFTEISMYPKLLINEGISAKEIITILLTKQKD